MTGLESTNGGISGSAPSSNVFGENGEGMEDVALTGTEDAALSLGVTFRRAVAFMLSLTGP